MKLETIICLLVGVLVNARLLSAQTSDTTTSSSTVSPSPPSPTPSSSTSSPLPSSSSVAPDSSSTSSSSLASSSLVVSSTTSLSTSPSSPAAASTSSSTVSPSVAQTSSSSASSSSLASSTASASVISTSTVSMPSSTTWNGIKTRTFPPRNNPDPEWSRMVAAVAGGCGLFLMLMAIFVSVAVILRYSTKVKSPSQSKPRKSIAAQGGQGGIAFYEGLEPQSAQALVGSLSATNIVSGASDIHLDVHAGGGGRGVYHNRGFDPVAEVPSAEANLYEDKYKPIEINPAAKKNVRESVA